LPDVGAHGIVRDVPEPRVRTPGSNRVWRHTCRIAAGLLAIILATLIACSVDDDLLDTSALRYEPRQIPDSENAFLILEAAAKRLGTPDIERAAVWQALDGRAWDDNEVAEWLRDRDFVIDAITAVRGLRHGQLHIPPNVIDAYGTDRPDIAWIGWLGSVRAQQLLRQGDTDAALNLHDDCWHAADLVLDSRGDILSWLQGRNMEFAATETAYLFASSPALAGPDLRELLNRASSGRRSRAEFEQLVAA
jgi:hypothetical protein